MTQQFKMANIVLLGPPGSGKGTQAEKISDVYRIPQISTGNILRHAIETGSELGLKARGYMDRGELAPDDVVDAIVEERLRHKDCERGFILDGFPRDLEQAHDLEKVARIDVVLDIRVPDEALIERLSQRRVCDCGETYHLTHHPPKKQGICDRCGKRIYQREDDKPETIKHRLQVYHSKTEPLIRFYQEAGVLREIDGAGDMETIFKQITAQIP